VSIFPLPSEPGVVTVKVQQLCSALIQYKAKSVFHQLISSKHILAHVQLFSAYI